MSNSAAMGNTDAVLTVSKVLSGISYHGLTCCTRTIPGPIQSHLFRYNWDLRRADPMSSPVTINVVAMDLSLLLSYVEKAIPPVP